MTAQVAAAHGRTMYMPVRRGAKATCWPRAPRCTQMSDAADRARRTSAIEGQAAMAINSASGSASAQNDATR